MEGRTEERTGCFPAGHVTRIHVNQHVVRRWSKGERGPAISLQRSDGVRSASAVEILVDGKVAARVVSRPDKPLSCGARIWIETTEEVRFE